MTHMQMIFMGIWQAIAPVAVAAACLALYYWWINRPHDDDDDHGDAPGLQIALPERIGFHTPKGKTA